MTSNIEKLADRIGSFDPDTPEKEALIIEGLELTNDLCCSACLGSEYMAELEEKQKAILAKLEALDGSA